MTIGSTSNNSPALPVSSTGLTANPATARPSSEATAAPTEASAQVALSSTAAGLLSGSASAVEFDSAKVDRISQAITNGEFKVDAGAIADKLIANATELLNKGTRQS